MRWTVTCVLLVSFAMLLVDASGRNTRSRRSGGVIKYLCCRGGRMPNPNIVDAASSGYRPNESSSESNAPTARRPGLAPLAMQLISPTATRHQSSTDETQSQEDGDQRADRETRPITRLSDALSSMNVAKEAASLHSDKAAGLPITSLTAKPKVKLRKQKQMVANSFEAAMEAAPSFSLKQFLRDYRILGILQRILAHADVAHLPRALAVLVAFVAVYFNIRQYL